ncbi:hypothetical protein ACP3S7_02665 [Phytobacter ursingii]
MNKVFLFLVFSSYLNVVCADDFVEHYLKVRKYAYGSLIWNGVKHSKPEVYSLMELNEYIPSDTNIFDIGSRYVVGQSKNKSTLDTYNINMSLTVSIMENNVIAKVNFVNNSGQSFFLYKKELPIFNGKICEDRFLIMTDDIQLNYLGGWCDFGSNFNQLDWVEVTHGSEYSYAIFLNQFYEFLPELKRYSIGSLEQTLINHDWMIRRHTTELMFSALDFHLNCDYTEQIDYLSSINNANICKRKNISDYLSDMGFYERASLVSIRTNEFLIDVDGREIKSFYSK